ncbi:hypothetical protein Sjap_024348 [Stephania japonica]|uniref:Uncharacterized protein n=1 Tax=Stephania japonica TaxID=461633 RepID=A0AAP0HNV9_9MAGN
MTLGRRQGGCRRGVLAEILCMHAATRMQRISATRRDGGPSLYTQRWAPPPMDIKKCSSSGLVSILRMAVALITQRKILMRLKRFLKRWRNRISKEMANLERQLYNAEKPCTVPLSKANLCFYDGRSVLLRVLVNTFGKKGQERKERLDPTFFPKRLADNVVDS